MVQPTTLVVNYTVFQKGLFPDKYQYGRPKEVIVTSSQEEISDQIWVIHQPSITTVTI